MNNTLAGKNGTVFNIQRYSLHDGPGIRTVIFLKGCPLRCQWCSNPESQHKLPELTYKQNKCIGCLRCKAACNANTISQTSEGSLLIDRLKCRSCFECTNQCPSKALSMLGQTIHVTEVINAAQADSAFYIRSGGGLTISGGEPLMQPEFVVEILKAAKKQRIDATIETCGYAAWETVKEVADHLNSTIIYDIKSMDSVKHKQFTGVTNDLILDNLIQLRETFPQLHILVRTPVIPGFNDSKADIATILNFLAPFANIRYELLPYHRLGQQKYDYLGRPYPLQALQLDTELMYTLQEEVRKSGLTQ